MKAANLIIVLFLSLLWTSLAPGQEKLSPLQPPDRSSPRATLKLFLDSCDQIGSFVETDFAPSPSRAGFNHLIELSKVPIECLDLSDTAPAGRAKAGSGAAISLYETLSRIELPPLDQVPGKDELKSLSGDPPRWFIPNTEIALVRMPSGPYSGEFRFSTHTVANAEDYRIRTQDLPYVRPVPLKNLYDIVVEGGGWLIPYSFVKAMPSWLRHPLAGDALWKWLGLVILLIAFLIVLRLVYRLSRRVGEDRPVLQAITRLVLPAYILLAVPVVAYLALAQINIRGYAGTVSQLVAIATLYLAGAWLSWRIADVLAEAIISSPKIKPRSIDAHLTRICTRLLGFAAAATLLISGADDVGIPVYGVIAGLGVGGLAIALAAQPSIENLIGGLNIFADRPIRVGHLCKYGTDTGIVEEIGIRSTRIRGADQTITTVPNGMLSKMSIVNMSQRERMLIQTTISMPGDAGRQRICYCLAEIQKMLAAHEKIDRSAARARLTRYTGSASDIEIFAYAMTRDIEAFLMVQQDVLLRVMEIVEQSKSSAGAGAAPVKA